MRKWFEIDNRGFTLMEILVTLIIASFVLMAIGSFVVRNIRYNAMANDQVYIQDQIRKTLKGMGSLIMDKKTVNINSTATKTSAIFNEGEADELEIEWDKSSKELFYIDGKGKKTLAKFISKFEISQDTVNPRLIIVEIGGEKSKAKFNTMEKYFLRN